MIRNEKKNFFSIINTSDITANKTFWKTVKPFFTDKIEAQGEIVSEKIMSEDQAVAEVFNKFFIDVVANLKISTDHGCDNHFIATDDQFTSFFWPRNLK